MNRKHVLCFYLVLVTQVEVWENETCCWNMNQQATTLQVKFFP